MYLLNIFRYFSFKMLVFLLLLYIILITIIIIIIFEFCRRDIDKMEKLKAIREASKRVALSPEILPSICLYTLLNSNNSVTAAEICEDSSLLAIGFSDAIIKVFSLTPQKLRGMKSAEALQDVDREAGSLTLVYLFYYLN